nr:methylated-DNA--[protein]-cysteine S-methyltransferase [Fodinibius saliphilus]
MLSLTMLDAVPNPLLKAKNSIQKQVKSELKEYFDGERNRFSIPVMPSGTIFQKSVWNKLQQLPFGQTITYGELAKRLGDTNKVRAVGRASGKNPIPIIIPCHRVIGINNNLIGYAGGVNRKKFLLKHEGTLLL